MAVNLTGLDLGAGAGAVDSAPKKSPAHPVQSQSQQTAPQQSQTDVSITSTASILAKLQQTLSAQPAVDHTRVDAVKKALASGQYKIQPDHIAARLTQSETALSALAQDK